MTEEEKKATAEATAEYLAQLEEDVANTLSKYNDIPEEFK